MSRVIMNTAIRQIICNGSTSVTLLRYSTRQPLSRTFFTMPTFLKRNDKPKVAVIHLCGMIMPKLGKQSGSSLNLESTGKNIDAAFKIKGLKEVCLVINSPGGSPVQSELISNRIMHLSQTKGVNVVSFVEDYAASGGYWLALAGNEIYSSESSIVGSIGVIGSSFGLQNVLKRLDIERRVIRMGKNKDIMDPFVPLTEEKEEIIHRNLSKIYLNFQNYVKRRRGSRLSGDNDSLFSGEYWVGDDAVSLGLIDGVKTLNDYLYEKYKDEVKVYNFAPKKSLKALFSSSFALPTVAEIYDDLLVESYKFSYPGGCSFLKPSDTTPQIGGVVDFLTCDPLVECVGKDEKLCRVVVFRSTGGDKLALMFSLNHTIGDGYTFYRLWKMFDSREEVRAMDVQRAHSIENLYSPGQNSINSGMWIHKQLEICKINYKGKPRRKRGQVFMRKVRNESMLKAKEECKTSKSYVSTNDVLCSWLFTGCKGNHAMNMTVNLRSRTAELTDDMAGNYIISCPVNVSESPVDYRMRWSSILKGETPHDKVERDNWSANWLTLYHQIEIDGCQHLLHLPVFRWADLEVLVSDVTDCYMYVFRLNTKDVGVVIGLNEKCFVSDFVNKCDLLECPGQQQKGYFLRDRKQGCIF